MCERGEGRREPHSSHISISHEVMIVITIYDQSVISGEGGSVERAGGGGGVSGKEIRREERGGRSEREGRWRAGKKGPLKEGHSAT